MNFKEHLHRQAVFSKATFGPGPRTEGVLDHISKEMDEVRKAKIKSDEWVDMVILSLDGLLRSIKDQYPGFNFEQVAYSAVEKIKSKQSINEKRDWPDWRTSDPNKAIEHVKEK